MSANADEILYWNEVAGAKWVEHQDQLDRLFAPLTEALLIEAAPVPGERVLDIGCGCGDLALRLACFGGQVDGVDVSKPMLAHAEARRRAFDPALAVTWIEADAMSHDFEPDYDLLASRFGVMFFDDRPRAFANLRKATKPGGRFAFLAWRGRAEVEWMQRPLEWITPAIPMPESRDGEIGPFAFSDGEATREQLADAGFWNVIAEPLDRTVPIGASVDEAFTLLVTAGPTSRALRDADEGARAKAETLLRRALEEIAADGRVEMRAACWIYRGIAG